MLDGKMIPAIIDGSFWSCCGFDRNSKMKKNRPYYFKLKEGQTIRKYKNFKKNRKGEYVQDHDEGCKLIRHVAV